MIWILASRGAATKLRSSPFTETAIEGVHSVVYKPGIEPIPFTGDDIILGQRGTFGRGLHRVSGFIFSYDGAVAQTLLGFTSSIDLLVRYRGAGEKRLRSLLDVIFIGDASVTIPSVNTGVPVLIGVPFRVQIPQGQTLSSHIVDTVEP